MARAVTARAASTFGMPLGAMTTTPYRRGPGGTAAWVEVVGARRVGCHVELETDEGKKFLVDLSHPIFPVDARPAPVAVVATGGAAAGAEP